MKRPIVVDTDMALDDWLAVCWLLSSPDAEVRAITIAATGEAHAGPGVRTALGLLALAGREGVEVASGSRRPLPGGHRFPIFVRWVMDVRFGLSLPKARQRPAEVSAIELLRRQLRAAAAPIDVVTLGPLTNLAELFASEPGLVERVRRLHVMGGALDVPGNLREMAPRSPNVHAEWNLYIDPLAVDRVLRSGVPVTLVPLDVTNRVYMTDAFLARLAATRATPAADFVHRVLRRIRPLLSEKRRLCFWDPLTAVLAVHPELGSYATRSVRIVLEEGPECGRLVDDPAGTVVSVCTGVDIPAFESIFLDVLNGRPAARSASARALP